MGTRTQSRGSAVFFRFVLLLVFFSFSPFYSVIRLFCVISSFLFFFRDFVLDFFFFFFSFALLWQRLFSFRSVHFLVRLHWQRLSLRLTLFSFRSLLSRFTDQNENSTARTELCVRSVLVDGVDNKTNWMKKWRTKYIKWTKREKVVSKRKKNKSSNLLAQTMVVNGIGRTINVKNKLEMETWNTVVHSLQRFPFFFQLATAINNKSDTRQLAIDSRNDDDDVNNGKFCLFQSRRVCVCVSVRVIESVFAALAL